MIDRIYGNLYIGTSEDAANLTILEMIGIGAVINCAEEFPVLTGRRLPYLHVKMLPQHEFTFMEALAVSKFYEEYKDVGILVHCHAGVERSPSVVVLILMYLGMTYDQARIQVANGRKSATVMLYDNVRKSLEKIFR